MRWMILGFPLVILMDCVMFVNFIFWQDSAYQDFQQRQLDLQVNYATDAAAQDMLGLGTHLDTDYASWGEMSVEPELALQTYEAVLLRNFGWSDTERNREDLIESSVPFFIVATYDGYYVFYKQKNETITDVIDSKTGVVTNQVTNTTFDMVWSPKLPYSEIVNEGEHNYRFYNLGTDYYGTLKYIRNNSGKVVKDIDMNVMHNASTISDAKECIATTLENACNSALYAGLNGDITEQWSIPNSFSQWSENRPIETVSILTYVTDINKISKDSLASFGLSGAKIDKPNYVICYTYNGDKLYTYIENRNDVENRGLSISSIVTSPKEAAKRGYYLDIKYLGEE